VKVRSLIEDIRDVRFHKVETDLEAFNDRTFAVKVIFRIFLAVGNFSNLSGGTMVVNVWIAALI